jgi:hypothetical protein
VVITGRCVDSALPLGALIHEFGWAPDDWDRLASGSLAGHILECGAQGSGGLHTDWERVERWDEIGYPIAEVSADGSFVVTKVPGTGGLVERAAVAEQLLYEIGDPGAYVLPDVRCDFTHVTIADDGPDRVRVSPAAGRPCTDTYKVSATYVDGLRAVGTLTIIGIDAAANARRTAAAILARTRRIFAARGLADYRETLVEIVGAESIYGPHARVPQAREVVMRLVVDHDERRALDIFAREIAPAGTSWSPGTTGAGGRPQPTPVVRLTSFLLPKSAVAVTIDVEGERTAIAPYLPVPAPILDERGDTDTGSVLSAISHATRELPQITQPVLQVPLVRLAWARSGDKGDSANIGVIARRPEYVPILRAQLTAGRVAAYFAHLVRGPVERYDVPGIGAFNFTLAQALGGGGMASQRYDPLAKGMAQMLLDLPMSVPAQLFEPAALAGAASGGPA